MGQGGDGVGEQVDGVVEASPAGTSRLVPGSASSGGVQRPYRADGPPRRTQPCRASSVASTAGSTAAGSGSGRAASAGPCGSVMVLLLPAGGRAVTGCRPRRPAP